MAAYYDIIPPSCGDRADGTGVFPGTPLPANIDEVIAQWTATGSPLSAQGFFEEDAASAKFDFGEQTTIQKVFYCDCGPPGTAGGIGGTYGQLLPLIQRGTIQTDSYGNVTKILNSVAERMKPNLMKLTITSEGLSFGIPPDQYSVEPQEINPDLMKHPRYNYGQNGNSTTGYGLTQLQKGMIRWALGGQNNYSAVAVLNQIFNGAGVGPGPSNTSEILWTVPQQQMAWEIIQKTYRGEDTWYLPALVVTWSRYYFPYGVNNLPSLNPGGYIEDPTDGMDVSIPYFFWSIDGTDNNPTNGSNDTLQYMSTFNSDLYADGVTYLRKADSLTYERTWFKYTRTWVGAPTGPQDQNQQNYIYWDPDLYPQWDAASQSFSTTALGPLPG
jgi:hypothetical protein